MRATDTWECVRDILDSFQHILSHEVYNYQTDSAILRERQCLRRDECHTPRLIILVEWDLRRQDSSFICYMFVNGMCKNIGVCGER
jgi:hypothetical protein